MTEAHSTITDIDDKDFAAYALMKTFIINFFNNLFHFIY
jgi:hypothetical protein